MFAELNSTEEKTILRVMLMKIHATIEKKNLFSIPLVPISDSLDEIKQFLIRNVLVYSFSKISLEGTGICYQLGFIGFDKSYQTLDLFSIRMLFFWLPLRRATISPATIA